MEIVGSISLSVHPINYEEMMKTTQAYLVTYEDAVPCDELTESMQTVFNGKNPPAVRGVSTGNCDYTLLVCSEPLCSQLAQMLYEDLKAHNNEIWHFCWKGPSSPLVMDEINMKSKGSMTLALPAPFSESLTLPIEEIEKRMSNITGAHFDWDGKLKGRNGKKMGRIKISFEEKTYAERFNKALKIIDGVRQIYSEHKRPIVIFKFEISGA